jgi:hypothetical protein
MACAAAPTKVVSLKVHQHEKQYQHQPSSFSPVMSAEQTALLRENQLLQRDLGSMSRRYHDLAQDLHKQQSNTHLHLQVRRLVMLVHMHNYHDDE